MQAEYNHVVTNTACLAVGKRALNMLHQFHESEVHLAAPLGNVASKISDRSEQATNVKA